MRKQASFAPEFFCYGPRPKSASLRGLSASVYLVLANARGIFARGMSVASVVSVLRTMGIVATVAEVRTELRKLRGLGIAEQLAADPKLWRVAR